MIQMPEIWYRLPVFPIFTVTVSIVICLWVISGRQLGEIEIRDVQSIPISSILDSCIVAIYNDVG